MDVKTCNNCRKEINAANFILHEAHCSRHMRLCTKCDEVYPKAEFEQHVQEQHAFVKCSECGEMVEALKMSHHQNLICPCRSTVCEFCDVSFQMKDLDAHQEFCGARTDECQLCNRRVQLRWMKEHLNTNCVLPLEDHVAGSSSEQLAIEGFYGSFAGGARALFPFDVAAQSNVCSTCGFPFDMSAASVRHRRTCPHTVDQIGKAALEPITISDDEDEHASSSPDDVRIIGSSSDDAMIPCEYCNQLISVLSFVDHQVNCANAFGVEETDSVIVTPSVSATEWPSTSLKSSMLGADASGISVASQIQNAPPLSCESVDLSSNAVGMPRAVAPRSSLQTVIRPYPSSRPAPDTSSRVAAPRQSAFTTARQSILSENAVDSNSPPPSVSLHRPVLSSQQFGMINRSDASSSSSSNNNNNNNNNQNIHGRFEELFGMQPPPDNRPRGIRTIPNANLDERGDRREASRNENGQRLRAPGASNRANGSIATGVDVTGRPQGTERRGQRNPVTARGRQSNNSRNQGQPRPRNTQP